MKKCLHFNFFDVGMVDEGDIKNITILSQEVFEEIGRT